MHNCTSSGILFARPILINLAAITATTRGSTVMALGLISTKISPLPRKREILSTSWNGRRPWEIGPRRKTTKRNIKCVFDGRSTPVLPRRYCRKGPGQYLLCVYLTIQPFFRAHQLFAPGSSVLQPGVSWLLSAQLPSPTRCTTRETD